MSFGDLLGSLTGNAASITNPTDATNVGIAVSVGDLIFGVIGEQTSMTSTGVTDNLGNTYTSTNNTVNDAGTSTGRAFYARVTVAGTLTAVHFAATASSDNVAVFAAVFKGPFIVSPLDTNPANITSDITSPFACPATGTLSQAKELVVAWGVATGSTVWAATSPNTLVGQATTASILHTVIGYQTVNATTTVTPNFTAASNPTDAVLGTASFKQELITRVGGKGHDVGLVLHAPLNEGVGLTAHDISGNLNHGTLTNTPTWVRDPRFGNTIKTVNASFQYVNFGDIQDANFVSTDSFSVLIWYKGDTAQFTAKQDNGSGSPGTTLTVSAITAGTILGVGMAVETTANASLTEITALGTGTGGTGTYTVNTTANVPSTNWLGAANGYQQFNSIANKFLPSGNFTGWEIYLDYGSNPRGVGGFKIIDTAGVNAVATTPVMPYITTGVWHLWAAVVDRTAQLCKLSFDGLPFGTVSCSTVGALTNTATVQVANQTGQAGTYHDFRIYKRALSLAEINAIYNGQRYDYRTSFRTNASRWNLSVPTTLVTLTGALVTTSAGSFSITISSNVTLTGASATTSPGSLKPTVSDTLPGIAATTSPGSFTPTVSKTLPGIAATTSPGSFTPTISDTLPGIAATTSPGSFTPTISDTLPGIAATTSPGSFTPTVSKTLVGIAATTSPGSFTPTASDTLPGIAATTSAGSFTPTISDTLPGIAATTSAGSFTPTVSKTLVGIAATTSPGSFTPTISKTLLGISVTTSAGTIATSTGGSGDVNFTLSGALATTTAGSLIPTLSKTVLGIAATMGVGSLASTIQPTFTGVSVTTHAGTLHFSFVDSISESGSASDTAVFGWVVNVNEPATARDGPPSAQTNFVTLTTERNLASTNFFTQIATSLTESGSASSTSSIIIIVGITEQGNASSSATANTQISEIVSEGDFMHTNVTITQDLIFPVLTHYHVTTNETGNAAATQADARHTFGATSEAGNASASQAEGAHFTVLASEHGTATTSFAVRISVAFFESGSASTTQILDRFKVAEAGAASSSEQIKVSTTLTETGNAGFTMQVQIGTHHAESNTSMATATQIVFHYVPQIFGFTVEEDALAIDLTTRPVISAKVKVLGSYDPVPFQMESWYPWTTKFARTINNVLAGKQNVSQITVTLVPNSAVTQFDDNRIGVNSYLGLVPLSSDAANEKPWFSNQGNGTVTINHANVPSTDRKFRIIIMA